jgi:hypothetical protein
MQTGEKSMYKIAVGRLTQLVDLTISLAALLGISSG